MHKPVSLLKREEEKTEIQRRRPCEQAAETRVMLPKVKAYTGPQKAGRGNERLPLYFWRKQGPANTFILDFWPQ